MHIEVQERRGRKFYYLARSFRFNGSVKKIRRYLGVDLSKEEVIASRKQHEQALIEQVESYKKIGDPFYTVLSSDEKNAIDELISKTDFGAIHLSEGDWLHFTEAFTYDTNAIEGSTITVSDVKEIIERNRWPSDKSKGEIAETYGVADAVKHIRKTKEHLSLGLMKKLHKIVFENSKPYAGFFRGKGIEVFVADRHGNIIHRGAPQKNILPLLKELIGWYYKNKKKYHSIVLAAVVHNQFENIHPFQDGNGRVGRLLLNNILLKNRMPPVNIKLKNREEYYSTLQEYEKKGNLRPTIELILKEYKKLKEP
jgi:Fic family protein